MRTIRFQRLREHAILPKRATEFSAGLDLCACLEQDVILHPMETVLIPTGFACAPETNDVALLIFARSGLSTKHHIALANGVGLVDADYRGELMVALKNLGTEDYTIQNGMRIAQLVETPVIYSEVKEVEEIESTERGNGGFGSTGTF